jgi:hypothetical protein
MRSWSTSYHVCNNVRILLHSWFACYDRTETSEFSYIQDSLLTSPNVVAVHADHPDWHFRDLRFICGAKGMMEVCRSESIETSMG